MARESVVCMRMSVRSPIGSSVPDPAVLGQGNGEEPRWRASCHAPMAEQHGADYPDDLTRWGGGQISAAPHWGCLKAVPALLPFGQLVGCFFWPILAVFG